MSRIDREVYPHVVIQIKEDEFPDELTILIMGNFMMSKEESNTTSGRAKQIAGDTASEAVGGGVQIPDLFTFVDEGDFTQTKTLNGVSHKVAKIDSPFDNITLVRGWASREDFNDDRNIDITMFAIPAAGGAADTSGFARSLTLSKRNLDVAYISDYFMNGTAAGQAGNVAEQVVPMVADAVTFLLENQGPQLPTAKQIASKLMGVFAAEIQQAQAMVAEETAKWHPLLETIQTVWNAVDDIRNDPKSAINYLPVILMFVFELIPKETLAKMVPDLQGG